MRKLILGLAFCTLSVSAVSGTVKSHVSFIQVNNGTSWPGLVAIKFTDMPTSRPSCATDQNGRFAFSLESDAGKAIYSMALAAQASGKILEVYGKNSCVEGTSIEELDYIRIID